MRILFLYLIQFYSLALAADHTIVREETAFDDIVYEAEDASEIPEVFAFENEEEDECHKWYREIVAFPHSDYRCYDYKRADVVKFIRIIPRYILYLNIRT